MTTKLVCASHSPLMLGTSPRDKGQADRFFGKLEELRREVAEFDPEVIAIFAPDHFNGFFYNVMPSFCIGFDAVTTPDWDIATGRLDVPDSLARSLVQSVREDGIDVAVSLRMSVDHGVTIPLNYLTGGLDNYPTIPIFVNCNAPPLPSCQRVRLMGEAVGRFLLASGKRVLIIGSGGLSHDPPHPPYEKTSPEIREYLLGAQSWGPEHEAARQRRVKDAARELVDGGGPCLPPNRQWDRAFLDLLLSQDLAKTDDFSDGSILRHGGSGGQEIRNWIAAFAALGAAGRYQARELYYEVVTEWITGMAIVRASI